MKVFQTDLAGVLLIEPDVFGDSRGFFLENWNRQRYVDAGFVDVEFVQANHSRSVRNVLRGLHFQLHKPQGKLVQVVRGRVLDVAADVRVGSPTFGRWVGFELGEDNHKQLWIPPGFAHGFCALTEKVDLTYLCTAYYDAASDAGVRWDDRDIGIAWPVETPLLSDKDCDLPTLSGALETGRLPEYRL